MVAPASALAAIADELGAAEAASLLCTGVTTFNALRHSGTMPGDVVAILGIGGLGHLGVQFANKLGFRTVTIARGADKAESSRKLGAHYFIDNATDDVAAALNRRGGARAVLATITSAEAISAAINGLGVRGRLVVIGVDAKPIQVSPLQLIGASRSVVDHAAGASIDSEDTLSSTLSHVRPIIETMPLAHAAEAYARMMRGDALPDGVDDGRNCCARGRWSADCFSGLPPESIACVAYPQAGRSGRQHPEETARPFGPNARSLEGRPARARAAGQQCRWLQRSDAACAGLQARHAGCLVRAGFATEQVERVQAGVERIEVQRLQISKAGAPVDRPALSIRVGSSTRAAAASFAPARPH
jgi:hypothetical protein